MAGADPVRTRDPRSVGFPVADAGHLASPSAGARDWVVRWWAGEGGMSGSLLRFLTLPMELGFRSATGLWNRFYDQGILPLQRAPVPVISVGNLTVGGSGKTPFSAWLAGELGRRGYRPALVARGYGEDEMILHRRWNPNLPILAEEDRAYGAWKAARKHGARSVVLDDGFQHRRLARDLDVVLVAASTPLKVRLLPRGPFREPLSSLARAGVVVLTQKGRDEDTMELEERLRPFLREPLVRVAFVADSWRDLAGRPVEKPDGEYLAVAGIGDPESFSRVLLEATHKRGELLAYPDHHAYAWADVRTLRERARGRTLVTTEKDAPRLEPFAKELGDLRVLHLRMEILEGQERLWRHLEGVLGAPGGPGA